MITRTVHKYPIAIRDRITVAMPEGATILHVARQHDTLCLWALVDRDAPMETRTFAVVGTGHPVPMRSAHIGTVIDAGGALVWHVFDMTESEDTND